MRMDDAFDPIDKPASEPFMGEIRVAENPVQLPTIERSLMEQVLYKNNLVRDLQRVKHSKSAAGIDGYMLITSSENLINALLNP